MTYKKKYRRKKRQKRKGRELKGGEKCEVRQRYEKIIGTVFFVFSVLFCVGGFLNLGRMRLFLLFVSVMFLGVSLMLFFCFLSHRRFFERFKVVENVRDDMTPRDFEFWVANLLKKLGYRRVKVVGGDGRGDRGVDVKCYSQKGELVYVQCKKYTKKVSEPEVRDFVGSMNYFKADKGLFVTTGYYTSFAKSYSKGIKNLELWGKNELGKLL